MRIILEIIAGLVKFFSNRQLLEAGKAEVLNDVHEAEREAVSAVQEIKRDNATLSPSDVDKRLHDDFRD